MARTVLSVRAYAFVGVRERSRSARARSVNAEADLVQRSQEAIDRFMMAMAGNLPHYEEAARALYAGAQEPFWDMTQSWPAVGPRQVASAGAFSTRDKAHA
jgi:hypothetical protein